MRTITSEIAATKLPHWRAVGMVLDQNARDMRARRYGRLHEVISWFKGIDLFRQAEFERMIERKPTLLDKRYHKNWLAALIAEGERLATELRQTGLPRNQAGIRLSDVEATVEELYDTQAEWHGSLKPEQRKASSNNSSMPRNPEREEIYRLATSGNIRAKRKNRAPRAA